MPRFAANLSLMYAHLPFMQRFAAAAADGFTAVEYLFPYAYPVADLRQALVDNGLQQVLFNAPPGGLTRSAMASAWDEGLRGSLSLPGAAAEAVFRAGIEQALEEAVVLDCPRIHVMSGLYGGPTADTGVGPGVGSKAETPAAIEQRVLQRLHWASALAQSAGRALLLEPINQRDMPGYYLRSQAQAHALVEAVASPHLQVQMDLYHCQISEGDVVTKLRHYLPTGRVGHIQIASVPERQEPDDGELNYPYLFTLLDRLGYPGWVGCEYRPRGDTSAGLGWLRGLGAQQG